MYINKVILQGNLSREPEMNTAGVVNLSVAVNREWKDKDGTKQSKAEFIKVSVFGKQAENCAKFLAKGQEVFVEGRIENSSWEDKNTGEKKYSTGVVAENVQFGRKSDKQVGTTNGSYVGEERTVANHDNVRTDNDINPEDIPF